MGSDVVREGVDAQIAEIVQRSAPIRKRRRPFVALLLSLLAPGLGQLYCARLTRGVFLYVAGLCLMSLLPLIALTGQFYAILAWLIVEICFVLFICIDAFIGARRSGETALGPCNRWYFYLAVALVHRLVVVPSFVSFLRSDVGLKAFVIRGEAMEPTLCDGDRVLVHKGYYRIWEPQHGDIIAFHYPNSPDKWFVKRIIAGPGDTIRIQGKRVMLNGQELTEDCVPEEFTSFDVVRDTTLPDGHYFVMGDHRSNSYDSRRWGALDGRLIIGKAMFIYWSADMEKIGKSLR